MTGCVRHQAVFSRIFNRHRFENNELEWLFRRYILRVSRSSSSSSVILNLAVILVLVIILVLILVLVIILVLILVLVMMLVSRCSMPRSDKQLPSLSFSLLPLPQSALSR